MRKINFVLVFLGLLFGIFFYAELATAQSDGLHIIEIVRLDPRFDKLVP